MEARKMAWGELKSFEKLGGRVVPSETLNVDDMFDDIIILVSF
jgi:hypothetical protein